ncbi:uncharacterized protein LOC143744652 isoform X2 [Siphateles boraxobius]|uniref:uncharacterized protein LOC143744652 isoform X2 n=1 Tax=Siphateles boraxobius TaxID=180520 RepID=UPI0040647C16
MRKLDSGDDDEDPLLPKMPRIVSTPKFTPRPEYFAEKIMKKCLLSAQDSESPMSDRETQHEGDDDDDEDPPLPKMPRTPRPEYYGERRMRKCLLSAQDPETPMSDRQTQHEADVPASAGETNLCNTELKKLERAMFIRLDKMDQKLSAIETLLRSIGQPTIDISEYLLNSCRSTQELNDLCSKMKDSEYREKNCPSP